MFLSWLQNTKCLYSWRHQESQLLPLLCLARPETLARQWDNELETISSPCCLCLECRDIMAPKQLNGRCSVFGCQSDKLSRPTFAAPSSESLRNQWVHFVFAGNAPIRIPKCVFVCAKHFTDDCFINLGQYKAGFAELLKMKPGSVPTLLASATNRGQVSTLTLYHVLALLCMITLLVPLRMWL